MSIELGQRQNSELRQVYDLVEERHVMGLCISLRSQLENALPWVQSVAGAFGSRVGLAAVVHAQS